MQIISIAYARTGYYYGMYFGMAQSTRGRRWKFGFVAEWETALD